LASGIRARSSANLRAILPKPRMAKWKVDMGIGFGAMVEGGKLGNTAHSGSK
jgi:hypothetical protein